MTALILSALKLIFVALLLLFVWQIAKAIAAHLGGLQTPKAPKRGTEIVFVRSDTMAGVDFHVDDVKVIGRSDQADIVIDDPYASEFHLRFSASDGVLMLQDLGSTNGTYVNGRRVSAPTPLNQGDAVQVGKTVMEVR